MFQFHQSIRVQNPSMIHRLFFSLFHCWHSVLMAQLWLCGCGDIQANSVPQKTTSVPIPSRILSISQHIVRVKATGCLPCSSEQDIVWPKDSHRTASPTVYTQPLTRHGTGFSVPHSRYGGRLILSNYHVVMPALTLKGRVWVRLWSGSWVQGRVVYTNAPADLAWVLLPPSINITPLAWGKASQVGQKVFALNMKHWPQGNALYTGRVMNTKCLVPETKGGKVPYFVQTSLPIQPGYSGGPLLNPKGQAIGVCSFGYTPENKNRWTMAIPSEIPSAMIVGAPLLD
jgi:S1-C subfamily serine protease